MEIGRHGTAQREKMAQGGPRAGLVQLINCFCSALGVAFNIHQPVMKESSELSLNIDGPGLAGCLLLALPPATERLPAWERPLGSPRKTPMCPARRASPREAVGKGGTHARQELRGVGDCVVPWRREGWWEHHCSHTRQHASSLHQPTQPEATKHLAPSFPDNMNPYGLNYSKNIPWVTPELAGSKWSHTPDTCM